jgi:HEAT repeat protein
VWWAWLVGVCCLATDEPVVAGATLAEWRATIANLELQSPESRRYVPGLCELVTRDDVPWITRRQAALTLGRLKGLSPEGVPLLAAYLDPARPETEETRLWAVKGLALYGAYAADSAPALWRLYQTESSSTNVRLAILEAFSQIGTSHADVIGWLIAVATPHDTAAESAVTLRRGAIEALGVIGPGAATAMPVLVRALDDPDQNLRREAVVSLGKLGPGASGAVPALLERLVLDPEPAVQDYAAATLIRCDPQECGPQLSEWLQAEDPALKRRILTIFAGWGPAARPWLAAIRHTQTDADPLVRLAARRAEWGITRVAEPLVEGVVAEFGDDSREVRRAAYLLWREFGPARVSAEPRLMELGHDPRPEVRRLAAQARREFSDTDSMSP